ncbi:MAG: hypothetical protein C0P74_008555 [Gammaproteobacteria bacterium]
MRHTWIGLLLAIGWCSLTAQEPVDDPRTAEEVDRVFDAMDRDGDDRISRSEAQRSPLLRHRFDGVDANEDGYVSRAEYRARPRNEPFE